MSSINLDAWQWHRLLLALLEGCGEIMIAGEWWSSLAQVVEVHCIPSRLCTWSVFSEQCSALLALLLVATTVARHRSEYQHSCCYWSLKFSQPPLEGSESPATAAAAASAAWDQLSITSISSSCLSTAGAGAATVALQSSPMSCLEWR